ncbi:MAG: DUF1150 domain-containing protein [Rhodobiaceae bacterium]|nr:DUF1150 domain-containing protein [Rhodobiaceae bacterium]
MTADKSADETAVPADDRIVITPEAFAALGGHEWAYLREMTAEEAATRFPGVPEMSPGSPIYAVFRADGTPIALTDTAEAAYENMLARDLRPVTVH